MLVAPWRHQRIVGNPEIIQIYATIQGYPQSDISTIGKK